MSTEGRDLTPVPTDGNGSRPSPSPGPEPAEDGRAPAKRKRLSTWQETVLLLGIALVLAIVIKALFVQAFYIPSASMEPGLVKNDRILVEKPSYWFDGSPQRGDVVVFKDPGGWLPPEDAAGPTNVVAKVLSKVGLYPTGGHLVKRVIGVEGDVITCCDAQGRISVNGQPLNEQGYAVLGGEDCYGPMVNQCSEDWTVGPVPKGHIFVMGDNRSDSGDSTVHLCPPDDSGCTDSPYISLDGVVGRVFALVWPASRADWIGRPDTFADVPSPTGGG